MAILIKTDNTIDIVMPANNKSFTLEELQKLVGGYIELVYTAAGNPMFIDEEGKLKGKPLNLIASTLFQNDWIVGDAVVCANEVEAGNEEGGTLQ